MNTSISVQPPERQLVYSEQEYRAIRRDSYSSLSLFVADKKGYHRKYVAGIQEDKPTPAQIYGSLVDCLLFTPQDFEDRFVIAKAQEPTPQMLTFTQNLVKRMVQEKSLHSKDSIRSLFLWAYNDTKYDNNGNEVAFKRQSLEKTMEKFFVECKPYCKELLSMSVGKQLIQLEDYNKAELAVDNLKRSAVTGPILQTETGSRYRVFRQLVVLYVLQGLDMKSMVDLVIVDDVDKRVWFFDLKTTHNVEQFAATYLKYRYYLQLGVYTAAMLQWMKEAGMADYILEPMRFIVTDSCNYMAPLIYATDYDILQESLLGFNVQGRTYEGVYQVIEDLQWHKQQDIWNMAHVHYRNSGVVSLKAFGNEDYRSKNTTITLTRGTAA